MAFRVGYGSPDVNEVLMCVVFKDGPTVRCAFKDHTFLKDSGIDWYEIEFFLAYIYLDAFKEEKNV